MAKEFSAKRIAIDKANGVLIGAVAVAAFVIVFSMVASKALIDQRNYQARVIEKKELARDTLKENIAAVETLNASYQEFAGSQVNVLGGSPGGKGDRDGENPRIVLDALPSSYDFPALTASVEKLLRDNKFDLINMTGTDDEIVQSANTSSESPKPIEIPFTVEANSAPNRAESLARLFERSIRPFQIRKLQLINQNGQLKLTLTGKTFFQPSKSLDVRYEVVK